LPAEDTDVGGVLFWPTPVASDSEGGISKDTQLRKGSFSRVNKKGVRYGVKLRDAVTCLGEGKHWKDAKKARYYVNRLISEIDL
jgi:hypothetical protein